MPPFARLNSHPQRTRLRRGIALANRLPVHRIPPRLEVVGATVLVAEIIGVLPDVIAEQRALAVHDRIVLVRAGLDREFAVLGDRHEHPARTKYTTARGVEVALEFFRAAEVAIDRGKHFAFRLAAIRSHDLPEHGVIGMAAEIVAHAGADCLRQVAEIAEDIDSIAAV